MPPTIMNTPKIDGMNEIRSIGGLPYHAANNRIDSPRASKAKPPQRSYTGTGPNG
jgi:hypothetical protein